MTKIQVKHAAKMMGVTEQCIRVGLQKGAFDFGVAFKSKDTNKSYYYMIYPEKLIEVVGQERFDKVMEEEIC